MVSASSAAAGTTLLTSPAASASAASSLRPVSIISRVRLRPTLRTSSAVIIIGHSPTWISVVPNTAVSAATTRSQATIRPRPPARAGPLTIATSGLPRSCMARSRSTSDAGATPPLAGACMPARSPPAENAGPAPVSTTTRTAGSARSPARASTSSPQVAGPIGLRLSGRLRVSRAIGPTSTRMVA